MLWHDAESLVLALESTFERIWRQRMRDLPIVNPRLAVRAVGVRAYRDDWLGVLITPWFMNLILAARREMPDANLRCGDKTVHGFPAGAFEFIAGEEAGIGRYRMCSLFSPMFEFREQCSAEQTALAVLQTLLAEPQAEAPRTISRRGLLCAAFARALRNADGETPP